MSIWQWSEVLVIILFGRYLLGTYITSVLLSRLLTEIKVLCQQQWSFVKSDEVNKEKKTFINKHVFLNSNNQNLTVEVGCVMVIIEENGIVEKSSN